MPRLSAEARATLTAARVGKLPPTRSLSAAEKRAWRELIDATPAGLLSERDRPLLESWCALTVQQRKLAAYIAAADAEALADPQSPAGRAATKVAAVGRTLATLANRLKIAPLAGNAIAHRAKIRDERPAEPAPLLGGLRRVV